MAAGDTTVDTVGEFAVRSMFPPDPSGIWLDRGLSGPHNPLLPPVVGTAANSPTVSRIAMMPRSRPVLMTVRPHAAVGLDKKVRNIRGSRSRNPGSRTISESGAKDK